MGATSLHIKSLLYDEANNTRQDRRPSTQWTCLLHSIRPVSFVSSTGGSLELVVANLLRMCG